MKYGEFLNESWKLKRGCFLSNRKEDEGLLRTGGEDEVFEGLGCYL